MSSEGAAKMSFCVKCRKVMPVVEGHYAEIQWHKKKSPEETCTRYGFMGKCAKCGQKTVQFAKRPAK